MDITLLVFSAVSAISTAITAAMVFQIQKLIYSGKMQQEKLLRVVENTNETSREIRHLASEQIKSQTEFDASNKKQIEDLIQANQNIENCLNELLQANQQSIDRLYNLLHENTSIQLDKWQAGINELGALRNSLDENVENRINELLQVNQQSSDRLYNLLHENTSIQLEKLKILADKLEELKVSLEESTKF